MSSIGADRAEAKARRILFGLGFDDDMQVKPTKNFSGTSSQDFSYVYLRETFRMRGWAGEEDFRRRRKRVARPVTSHL
jgi:hypothetical protein